MVMNKARFVATLQLALILVLSGASGTSGGAEESFDFEVLPLHNDAGALREGFLEAIAGLLDEDQAAAIAGLEMIEDGCRRAKAEEVHYFGEDIVRTDRQFHEALDFAREDLREDNLDRALKEMNFIIQSCRNCHKLAREQALQSEGPASGGGF
jgi:hypothetical protein